MSGVTLTAATRSNLLAAQDTAALLSTTQQRLSTGKKVNSALDNAVSFFTAQGLDNRASSLTTILDGISNGIQTIKAANQGITNIKKLTDQLTSISQQALSASAGYATKSTLTSTALTGATAASLVPATTVTGSTISSTSLLPRSSRRPRRVALRSQTTPQSPPPPRVVRPSRSAAPL